MTALDTLRHLAGEDGVPVPACPDCPNEEPARELTDEQLLALLEEAGGDLEKAAYLALLHKSQNSDLTLSSGLRLPDQSAYYRRLARLRRKVTHGPLRRADEVTNDD